MEPDLPPCLQEMLPRSPARVTSRRGRSPMPSTSRRLPRLSTSTAGKATKKSGNGDKKARAAQRGAQGRHLHLQGYQVQQERLLRQPTRRLVLPREVPKDTIYIYKAPGQESWPAFLRRIQFTLKTAFFKATNKMKRSNHLY